MKGKRVAAAQVVAWLGALRAYLASVALTRLSGSSKSSLLSLCSVRISQIVEGHERVGRSADGKETLSERTREIFEELSGEALSLEAVTTGHWKAT